VNIRRTIFATLGTVIVSTALISAQDSLGFAAQTSSAGANTVTFRGCLNQGAADRTYVLSNAAEKGQKDKKRVTLKVVSGSEKVKLDQFLSRDVEITGEVRDGAGDSLDTLSATKVTWKADYCG
jgi:hypothetical protein